MLTDGKWLGFVVEQVLSNALKYTPEGGTIRIYGDRDTVVIADDGIGIRPEDLHRGAGPTWFALQPQAVYIFFSSQWSRLKVGQAFLCGARCPQRAILPSIARLPQ